MGRKTFESIGRPLPGRRNMVITRNAQWRHEGVETSASLEQALAQLPDNANVFVIGGGELYAQALAMADELILTELDADFDGDTFFPAWDRQAYEELARQTHTSDHGWTYHFVRYARVATMSDHLTSST
jgi:dihydrofolate reductase